MRFRLPFTNRQLLAIASFGGVFVAGECILMQYLTNKKFHQSPYFVLAAETIFNHKGILNHFGEPLNFGNPDLSDNSRNFSTAYEAQFVVPLKGSRTKGFMSFEAVRRTDKTEPLQENEVAISESAKKWSLRSLEVMVDDRPNEKIVLVRKKVEQE